ncbi:Protein of unknown function [Pyronema omphalodes CBS 100304]|uniref:Secreted protein n=1 Tax=Pyronema omphalodes (strain CBS 100304) TaxID=1076935 RepID=U4L7N5_PYROM|nr:Protein of unknown function [Pyronema omphalodes CBS 100304]
MLAVFLSLLRFDFQCICGLDAIDIWALELLWRPFWLAKTSSVCMTPGDFNSCSIPCCVLDAVTKDGDRCGEFVTFLAWCEDFRHFLGCFSLLGRWHIVAFRGGICTWSRRGYWWMDEWCV